MGPIVGIGFGSGASIAYVVTAGFSIGDEVVSTTPFITIPGSRTRVTVSGSRTTVTLQGERTGEEA